MKNIELSKIIEILQSIDHQNAETRLPPGDAGSDYDALASAINGMLDRLSGAAATNKSLSPEQNTERALGLEMERVDEMVVHAFNTSEVDLDEVLRQTKSISTDGVAIGDTKGGITYANARFAELLGVTQEELIGKSLSTFMDAENLKRWKEHRLLRGEGQSTSYELAFDRPDGSRVYCKATGVPLVDESGNWYASIGVLSDITALKKTTEALEKYRMSVELAPESVFWIQRDGSFSYVNHEACRRLGYTRAELMELTLFDIDPFYTREFLDREWADFHPGQPIMTAGIETFHRSKDGTLHPIEVSAQHFWIGEEEFHVAFVRDTSERKKTEEGLRLLEFCVENASVGVYRLDETDGSIQSVNKCGCEMLGYSREELLGMDIFDINPRVSSETWAEYRRNMIDNNLTTFETVHQRKDGTLVPVEITVSFIEYQDRKYSFSFSRDISSRLKAQEELKQIQLCVEKASVGIFRIDEPDGQIHYANEQACRSLGYEREELIGKTVLDIDPTFNLEAWREHRKDVRVGAPTVIETIHRRKDGTTFPVEIVVSSFELEGEYLSYSFSRDISERRKAEEEKALLETQLLQAQKMESIGQLAGGVAHDFNNMLSVILGSAELIRTEVPENSAFLTELGEIEKAALRSRDITRQLLAFSRKQSFTPGSLNLTHQFTSLRQSLMRLIGENVELEINAERDIWKVRFDPAQLDQVIINLLVNARDAMPDGGKLTISIRNREIDGGDDAVPAGIQPGEYVQCSFADNGVGMDERTVERIFEPFFTTKEVGKGTGLGLSTVFGIVNQNNCFIDVISARNVGTTFRIFFPRDRQPARDKVHSSFAVKPSISGTIMLVEDDPLVRKMMFSALQTFGVDVIVASSGSEAIELVTENDLMFDLLLTDVVMPGMNGYELADRMLELLPDIRVVLMSGYAPETIDGANADCRGHHFLQKPFSMEDFSKMIENAFNKSI